MSTSSESVDSEESHDEEKAFLAEERHPPKATRPSSLSRKFWISSVVNIISTVALVFVNKRIFETESLRHAQVTYAAFHFAITSGLLYLISRPWVNMFKAKRVDAFQILPLALAMIFNVVLQNASLAYSSIQFYQIVRTLLTPCTAVLNFVFLKTTLTTQATLTLVPICIGVAVVSYFDTLPSANGTAKATSTVGVVFAFSGVLASSIYTTLIGTCHKTLDCTSQQLLLNQAPVSVLLMLYVIPFSDDVTAWSSTPQDTWLLILLSGALACFLNVSQFVIIDEAGPVSSTIVGQTKACLIILLGWIYSGRSATDKSVIGIVLATGGIISYCIVTQRQRHARP